MNWSTQSRQRSLAFLAVAALVLSLMLSACRVAGGASNSSAPTGNPVSTQTQQQPATTNQPSDNPSPSASQNSSSNIGNTDQQIQNLLRQLDGSQNDVNNADNGVSQDGQ